MWFFYHFFFFWWSFFWLPFEPVVCTIEKKYLSSHLKQCFFFLFFLYIPESRAIKCYLKNFLFFNVQIKFSCFICFTSFTCKGCVDEKIFTYIECEQMIMSKSKKKPLLFHWSFCQNWCISLLYKLVHTAFLTRNL